MAQTRGRKTSSKRKTNNRGKSKRSAADRFENTVIDEVFFLVSIAVTILLFLCNFNLIGKVGEVLSNIMFGLFGYMAYVAPLLIFFAFYFGLANMGNHVATIKLVSGCVLFCMCCVIFTLFGGVESAGDSISSYYRFSAEGHHGGGVIGGFFGHGMYTLLGMAGTVIVVLVLVIVCAVLVTERSFVNGVKKSSKAVVETARSDADRRREMARERMEQRALEKEEKQRRMDKKASGIPTTAQLTLKDSAEEDTSVQATEQKKSMQTKVDYTTEDSGQMAMEALAKIRIKGVDDQPTQDADQRIMGQEIGQNTVETKQPTTVNKVEKPEKVQLKESDLDISADMQKIAKPKKEYKFPPLNLLSKGARKTNADNGNQLRETALRLQQTLHTFGVNVTVTDISQGPAVTRYELQPEVGVKVSKIVNLADDIKLNLAATDIRIEAPIPGKAAVGIEVPNSENSAVALRDLLESSEFKNFDSKLAFAVGKDIGGKTVVTDIAKMPHMLIAGSTGSGKSVCINTIIMSLLYKAKPDEVKLIMIDPKVVELSVYNGIPHLMVPVVTDPKKAAAALHWGVAEMEDRYRKFADFNVRDLKGYNKKVSEMTENNGQPIPEKLPQVVIIVDELADLMMVAPGEVEESICRLAQLARAAGIHLIIATQRPSVDVITGLIKANMPSRVAFAVSSGVDSRTILDMNGAEKLLGKGDMLFYPQGMSKPARVQGAFVSDKEVSEVVDFIKAQCIENEYAADIEAKISNISNSSGSGFTSDASERDSYFVDAGRFIIEKEKASIGMLQRVFKIGFNRAARIMDQLEEVGVVGPEEGTKPRRVLMSEEQFEQLLEDI
ncbi:MAG: DNA translocase FtsK [Lachnospiraceae bacterium]|nr:DNA translocase FtsK [Lachnospiraceae bacterium]